jgi:hypothetical protein
LHYQIDLVGGCYDVFDFWYFVEEEEEEYDRRNKA